MAAPAKRKPSPDAVTAWARINRVQTALLAAIEKDLKAAGLPPLAWYDALLELTRAENGALRPLDLEKAMLLPQYSTSRLVDRLEKAELVTREPCPGDGRGQLVVITPAGRALQRRMWDTYAAAIERHVGAKLPDADMTVLNSLLAKLI